MTSRRRAFAGVGAVALGDGALRRALIARGRTRVEREYTHAVIAAAPRDITVTCSAMTYNRVMAGGLLVAVRACLVGAPSHPGSRAACRRRAADTAAS